MSGPSLCIGSMLFARLSGESFGAHWSTITPQDMPALIEINTTQGSESGLVLNGK
jgi:hypothetical protein